MKVNIYTKCSDSDIIIMNERKIKAVPKNKTVIHLFHTHMHNEYKKKIGKNIKLNNTYYL